jgi:hypothetical protein
MDFDCQAMNEAGRLVARCELVNIRYHFACDQAANCCSPAKSGGMESTRKGHGLYPSYQHKTSHLDVDKPKKIV